MTAGRSPQPWTPPRPPHDGRPSASRRMRLLFAGTPEVAVGSLDALLGSRHEVIAVLTRPDAPSGRGRRLEASPVAIRAEAAGIEVLRPRRPRDDEFRARLA